MDPTVMVIASPPKLNIPDLTHPQNTPVFFVGPHSHDGSTSTNGYYQASAHHQLGWRYELVPVGTTNSIILGIGTFGSVYSAIDHKHSRPVAIKVIRQFPNPAVLPLCLAEVNFLQTLSAHDPAGTRSLRFYKHFMFRGHLCIVMELFAGESLRSFLNTHGHGVIGPKTMQGITTKLLQQLALCKEVGIIHADIKPDNILVQWKPLDVRLIDFGLARFVEDADNDAGTRWYQPPELLVGYGERSGAAVDMWALGITLCELVAKSPLPQRPRERWVSKRDMVILLGGVFGIRVVPRRGEKVDLKAALRRHYHREMLGAWGREFVGFVGGLLRWWPEERWTPEEALRQPWVTRKR